MARLSDIIEQFIKDMMKDKEDDELEIVRNELANYFSCAPSQINYVLTTRFTTDKGYYIESKRGGGGCIKIRKIQIENFAPLYSMIDEKIGNSITYDSAIKVIEALYEADYINKKEAAIMGAAINERAISSDKDNRNRLRASILKSMITIILLP
ncbi:CtsR family transcriptional regulator [Haloimpatiens sp. FM7315]|uniref:CtsR family transcriptional regulator n=1 Tax=Haloimpatiens sp. FM7315 TaxID=3298609 RepID=UPI0035A34051